MPVLKPSKNPALSSSYRPISLLCPAAKIAERLLLPTLTELLPTASSQHGFRANHSTTTALTCLANQITTGFNDKQPAGRTVLVALDLSKAFDTVNHNILISDLLGSRLPGGITRWIANYLLRRRARTIFREASSPGRHVHTGVPQGAVLSPSLFNFYISALPAPPPSVKLISYADDLTLTSTNSDISVATASINRYLPVLVDYLHARNLIISTTNSTVSLLTPHAAQSQLHPQIYIDNQFLPLERQPKILGLTFDTHLTFTPHTKASVDRCQRRNNILKSLAGSSWGQQKETLIVSYKAVVRPVLEYGAPVWAPILADSNWARLQRVQNAALRTVTGCHQMASIDHLHQEARILPIRQHSNMLAAQFALSCHLEGHPCRSLTTAPPPPRQMKHTIFSKFERTLAEHLCTNPLAPGDYKRGLTELHTTAISDAVRGYAPSIVLGGYPPPISGSEATLPRAVRARLSQLRSGYCSVLNSYKSRIDPAVANTCPDCDTGPHDVNHLFNCTQRPTTLSARDLWTNPLAAATFLQLTDD